LELDAEKAFQWLGTGGFVEEDLGVGGFGTIGLGLLHQVANRFSDVSTSPHIHGMNTFQLDPAGAKKIQIAYYDGGRVERMPAAQRGNKTLPLIGMFGMIVNGLQKSSHVDKLLEYVEEASRKSGQPFDGGQRGALATCLEAMVRDGWVSASFDSERPALTFVVEDDSEMIAPNEDILPATG
jgi:hypothetical protein